MAIEAFARSAMPKMSQEARRGGDVGMTWGGSRCGSLERSERLIRRLETVSTTVRLRLLSEEPAIEFDA
ncbi:protein of unknown function (plasmid) [Cupriavidus taiwanensis]|uniref:Uncharacterized protein n=1 Tax=Cupriavidus taiwanensis TaxID=164546 RepID=A0A375IV91_9BURK|nr:protein of unknown function [Cupriavidus taiwanensis]